MKNGTPEMPSDVACLPARSRPRPRPAAQPFQRLPVFATGGRNVGEYVGIANEAPPESGVEEALDQFVR